MRVGFGVILLGADDVVGQEWVGGVGVRVAVVAVVRWGRSWSGG